MKKIFLSLVVLLAATAIQAQKALVNDANAEERTLTASFKTIKISGGMDLYLSQYEKESIAVSASKDEYRKEIKTVVENGVLKIYYEGNKSWKPGNKNLKVYVSFKTLEAIEASGACDVHVAGTVDVPSLKMDLSGACDFDGALKVNNLSLELSGASDVKLRGSATTVTIESSGASDVNGYDLVTEVCTAKASGASDINISVNKELSAHASGASAIHYKGNAVMKEQQSSGASTISKKS